MADTDRVRPLTPDNLRRAINGTADIASEWSGVLGNPAKGSPEHEFQRVPDDIVSRLSRISFNVGFRGVHEE